MVMPMTAPRDALRYRYARASRHPFPLPFNAAPPQTPPPKAKIFEKEMVGGLLATSSSQKLRFNPH